MTNKIIPFNPLDKKHLGESVGQAMLRQSVTSFSKLNKFNGAGVYAIYYIGDFPSYQAIAARNKDDEFLAPIYVGKAVPSGTRKGKISSIATTALYKRLNEHKKSIEEAENLSIDDFHFRALVVDDIWIPLGESLLISKFAPIWNNLVDGFGNHNPGKGRVAGLRPRWDVLHPGRSWADNFQPRSETMKQIMHEVEEHLRSNPPPDNNVMITV